MALVLFAVPFEVLIAANGQHEAGIRENIADIIAEPEMRQSVVRILALLPVIDKRILAAKVAVVEQAARQLGVEDRGLEILRLAVKGKFRSIGPQYVRGISAWRKKH